MRFQFQFNNTKQLTTECGSEIDAREDLLDWEIDFDVVLYDTAYGKVAQKIETEDCLVWEIDHNDERELVLDWQDQLGTLWYALENLLIKEYNAARNTLILPKVSSDPDSLQQARNERAQFIGEYEQAKGRI